MSEQDIEKLRVIYCRPGEKAEIIEMDHTLHNMQAHVGGGLIQEYFPFHDDGDPRHDDVAIICNEEGKLNGMPANRAVYDEKGEIMDIMMGPFFIVYAPIESEIFCSLPEDLAEEYRSKFELPEMFFRDEEGFRAVKYDPETAKRKERTGKAR